MEYVGYKDNLWYADYCRYGLTDAEDSLFSWWDASDVNIRVPRGEPKWLPLTCEDCNVTYTFPQKCACEPVTPDINRLEAAIARLHAFEMHVWESVTQDHQTRKKTSSRRRARKASSAP